MNRIELHINGKVASASLPEDFAKATGDGQRQAIMQAAEALSRHAFIGFDAIKSGADQNGPR